MKNIILLLLLATLSVACDAGFGDLEGSKKQASRKGGATGGTTGYGGGADGGAITPPADAPQVTNPGEDSEEDGPGCAYDPPFDFSDILDTVDEDITSCVGRPLATDWLIAAVRKLQETDPNFGFMIKDGGNKIPRDIVAYNWLGDGEGSNWFYVFDVVGAGCNNSPSDPDYEMPALDARVAWQFCNPDGFADNGYWSANP